MYLIKTGSFNLIYPTLSDCNDAIKRFNLKHYKVVDQETGKTCFHS